MELKSMTFATDTEGDTLPDTITVSMSTEEALWIALIAGKQRGSSPHNGIYSCLTGNVFNRYWEDGVDDAKKRHHFELPPVQYSES